MTAAEGSSLGFAIQSAVDTPETRDAQFTYLLFNEGGVGPNDITLPLDPEIGGGALLNSVVKAGTAAGGAVNFIPRPKSLGFFLYGATGQVTTVTNYDDDGLFNDHALDGSTVNLSPAFTPAAGTRVCITGSVGAAGNVVVTGTVGGVPATSETIALNGITRVVGTSVFTVITSVQFPTNGVNTVDVGFPDGSYTHTFRMGTDQFAAPYWTTRSAPGNMWGEQFTNCRMNALGLEFRGANFLRATAGIVGAQASRVATTTWDANSRVDRGPQFLSPVSSIQVPHGTATSVLRGSFVSTMAIPLDEQYVVGSYFPEGLDIVSRAFAMQLLIKVRNNTLYDRVKFDPAGGASWVAQMYKEANMDFYFQSDGDAALIKPTGSTGNIRPYLFSVNANGQTGENANVFWSANQITLQAQRQVTMALTGMFTSSPTVDHPVTFTLINRQASYAYVAP